MSSAGIILKCFPEGNQGQIRQQACGEFSFRNIDQVLMIFQNQLHKKFRQGGFGYRSRSKLKEGSLRPGSIPGLKGGYFKSYNKNKDIGK